jgi:hypothetical protein
MTSQPINNGYNKPTSQSMWNGAPAGIGWPISDGKLSTRLAHYQQVNTLKGLTTCSGLFQVILQNFLWFLK